jgi:hypothetical protein
MTCTENKHYRADVLDALAWEQVKEWLTDPEKLQAELTRIRADRDQDNAPMRERLVAIDGLLADNRAQLGRARDLYLAGDFDRDMLTERKARLEQTIAVLEGERETLAATLEAQSLTDGEIETVMDLASQVRARLAGGETDFARRSKVIEMLDMQARLWTEDGRAMARLTCRLLRKEAALAVTGGSIGSDTLPSHRSHPRLL